MQSENTKRKVNLILLGETGSGKSATGNVILSGYSNHVRQLFPLNVASDSGTKEPDTLSAEIQGTTFEVLDTTGSLHKDDTSVKEQARNVIKHHSLGFDAILMVLRCHSNPTKIEASTLSSIQLYNSVLGDEMWKYCIFVVTHGDTYHKYLDELRRNQIFPCKEFEDQILRNKYSMHDKRALGPLIQKAAGGAVLFDNQLAEGNKEKKKEMLDSLMSKVKMLQEQNKNKRFSHLRSCIIL